MKLKYKMLFRTIGDVILAIPVDEGCEKAPNYIILNSTSHIIASNMVEETTEEVLVNKFLDTFDVDPEVARRDVHTIVEWLQSSGLVEV